ncbi:putative 2-aminoethylphosphonate ABC transporter permease subunit [Alcaligenes endophyticus]|uniref:2-aminoethylphosphonate ABC transporter permease subunit n=1 Tax=Alcaligenes endophyticus TaxID=1929088 RepID=A0ABT8EIF9_9BURK|nr:putative 2-aminoethylphosphonate ABC transporter permease subunit [Alcaligenes endophyticus]MCX5592575.1 putative 2-aminoethylphosphonate ABC transporter permease subunit [Alcaligenes endophyticus]MDN4121077.1 putative 2-aminoethylphosphonate ABC transporter permease subunit [Alcaligenes endophyticus]
MLTLKSNGDQGISRRPWAPSLDKALLSTLFILLLVLLTLFLVLPMLAVLWRALQNEQGQLSGGSVFFTILTSAGFMPMVGRSLLVGVSTVVIVIPSAYAFAFALQRCCLRGASFYRSIGLLPLLAPSLMPGLSLIYLFGNQGLLRGLLGEGSIYGFWGIVLGESFYTFPHALMILSTGLALADARLYDAARAMGANARRRFLTVTLPASRYAIFTAACLVFTLTVTDFGVPKVVGGSYNVLAMEAYKAVVGQLQFSKGAAIGMLLLIPAVFTFLLDQHLRRRNANQKQGQLNAYCPLPLARRDQSFTVITGLLCLAILIIVGMAVWASLITFWPYNLGLSLKSYDFDNMDGGGWLAWRNSLSMSFYTAMAGTGLIFLGAWLLERLPSTIRSFQALQGFLRMLALIPMAIPGLVLGLGYIFFFNAPSNPLNGLYGSMGLLVLCTIVHLYTSAHLTFTTALRAIPHELDAASASLRASRFDALARITLPLCLPALLAVARYLFVSAMTTVSAVVFLYSPKTVLASVAVLNMDDAGSIGPAAAMCTLIMLSSGTFCVLIHLLSKASLRRTQAWRAPQPR